MSRELKMLMWCDGEHDSDTEATVTRTLAVDGGKPMLLDLCDVCDKIVQDMVAFMERGVIASKAVAVPRPKASAGLPVRATSAADGSDRTDCLEEGCGYVGPTRTALGQHVRKQHSRLLGDYNWKK